MKLLLVLLSLSNLALAADFSGLSNWNVTKWNSNTKLLEVKEAYVDYLHYTYAVEPFMTPNVPTNAINLHVNLELLNRTMFIDNMIHSETDQYQYALVGWNYRVGFHIGNYLDVFYDHFSQHLLDTTSLVGPESYDSIGFRLYFYKR